VQKFFTIGMAGHIDHGKTTLTKALTGIDTDRLKEEKERQISIEPGFALLVEEEDIKLSIIDVPGHERFIRQMIAGVAGVDIVVLVVAADEGVMPQTEEHLHILSLLGMDNGVIALTKADLVEEELLDVVKEDISETVEGTFLENAPFYIVDSKSKRGIDSFRKALIERAIKLEKKVTLPSFRLPIDHVFTVQGQGTVVRGTVFDGEVRVGEEVQVLPQEKKARVRQIQSHHQLKEIVYAGERAALNLGGISYEDIHRGDVLVKDAFFEMTKRLDVALTPVPTFQHRIKQRQIVKVYVGTAEVMGRIIFYDRNELDTTDREEILCQIELEEPVVVTRGDRFIVRRASPMETIGGGWIIQSQGERRGFGEESITLLQQIKEGTPKERIDQVLSAIYVVTKDELLRQASVSEVEWKEIQNYYVAIDHYLVTKGSVLDEVEEAIVSSLANYHKKYPLRLGRDKAELISSLENRYPKELLEYTLKLAEGNLTIKLHDQYVSLYEFSPEVPQRYKENLEEVFRKWEADGAEVEVFDNYLKTAQIDQAIWKDVYYFLLQTNRAYEFDEGRIINRNVVEKLSEQLYEKTDGNNFTLQIAREIFRLSRKNLIPLLELFDSLQYTKRVDNERVWLLKKKLD